MDELLEVFELFADFGLEGVVSWLFRLLGLVAILAGIGLWLLTDLSIVVPVALVVVGLALVIVPGLLLELVA